MRTIFSVSRAAMMAVLVFALGGITACDRLRNYSEQELVQRAKDFQNKGDLKASVIELKNALQKNPSNTEARWLLGEIYIQTGQGNEAEKELLKARQLGVEPESLVVPLGQAHILLRQYAKVLDEVRPSEKTSTRNFAKILQIRGDALYGLGKYVEACAAFADSLSKDSAYVPAYWGLAKCAVGKGDANLARAQLAAAFKLEPKNVGTWLLLGDMERSLKRPSEAEAAYSQILKLQPNNVAALTNRAMVSIGLGHHDSAQKDIKKLHELEPRMLMARYLQGLLYYNLGNFKAAREELLEVLRIEQNHVPTLLLAGSVAYAMGNYQEAETRLSGVLARLPRELQVRKLLAATQLRLDLVGKALETLSPALDSPHQDAQTLTLAGEAFMRSRDYAQAANLFEKATALEPKRADLKTALGRSKLASGEVGAAIGQLEAAIAIDPKDPQADILLAFTYLRNKEYDKALTAIASLDKKLPNNPLAANLKGSAFLGKKDLASARKSFEYALSLDAAFVPAAINLAEMDLQDKNFQAAKKRFEVVLVKDKHNLQAMSYLAKIGQLSGNPQEQGSWLERAIASNPKRIEPRLELADYYLRRGEPQKAIALASEARELAPDDPLVLGTYAAVQAANGELNNAVATYNRLLQLLPKAATVHYRLALVQVGMGKMEEARISLTRALNLKPNFMEAMLQLALLEIKAGHHEKALEIAKEVQQKNPQSSLGFSLEGDIWMARNKYQQAAVSFATANQLVATSGGLIKQHLAMSKAGKVAEADSMLLGWVKSNPSDIVIQLYLGEAYTLRENAEPAIEQYQAVLQKDPENLSALNNLAVLLYNRANATALQYAERAYKLRPGSAPIADTLGWIRLGRGDLRQGLELLQKASRLEPNAPQIRYHLAVALVKSGNKTQARTELERLLRSNATFKDRAQAQELLRQL